MLIPTKRLTREEKEALIQQFDTNGQVARARAAGRVVSVDITSTAGELLMGADIHFTVEHRDPHDGLGWVGVFWSDAPHSPSRFNMSYAYGHDDSSYITPEEQRRRMDHGVHPFGRLGRRDYNFFARLAGVRGDGPEPNGVPSDASALTQRCVARWGDDGHSHGHMTLREFVRRNIISDDLLTEAAKTKLQGGDPIAEYLGDRVGEYYDITLDDNTRVVYWFDN